MWGTSRITMKKNILTLLLGLVVTVLPAVTGGCTPDGTGSKIPSEPSSLELSKTELVIGKEAALETVNVTTDADAWSFLVTPGEADWIDVKQTERTLEIGVKANESATSRHSVITVIAGGLVRKVTLEQSASDLVFFFDGQTDIPEDQLILSALGNEKLISVRTNDKGWHIQPVDSETSWLTVHTDTEAGVILLEAERNPEVEARVATLSISLSNGTTQQLTVTQAGQLRYFLPYQENHNVLNYKDLIIFEKERGNALTYFQRGDDSGWWTTPDILTFATSSDVLPRVTYSREIDFSLVYNYAEFPIADKSEIQEGGGFRKFLESQGYVQRSGSTSASPQLESPDGFLFVDVKENEGSAGNVRVRFTPQILQGKDMPTFKRFPYGVSGFYNHIHNVSWKYPQIEEWEVNTLKSTSVFSMTNEQYLPASSEMLLKVYKLPAEKSNPEDEDFHWYQFYFTQGANKTDAPSPEYVQAVHYSRLVFKDYEKVIFLIGDNQFKVTREFKKLAEADGFIYKGIYQGAIVFDKPKDEIRLSVQMDKADAELFGAPVVAILSYEHYESPQTTTGIKATMSDSRISDPVACSAVSVAITK